MNKQEPRNLVGGALGLLDLSTEEADRLRKLISIREIRQEEEIAQGMERALSLVPRLVRPAVRRLLFS